MNHNPMNSNPKFATSCSYELAKTPRIVINLILSTKMRSALVLSNIEVIFSVHRDSIWSTLLTNTLSVSFKQKNYKPAKEFWIIDPIDGTKEFVNKSDEFTTNIALIQNGKPVLGVVGAPAFNKVWSGVVKKPNPKNNSTKNRRSTLRIVTSNSHGTVIDTAFLNFLDKKGHRLKIIPKGSSLKICTLADKKADIYPRFGPTSEWDIAAADAILRSSGGGIFQIENQHPLEYGKKDSILNPMFIALADLNEKKTILSLMGEFNKNLL